VTSQPVAPGIPTLDDVLGHWTNEHAADLAVLKSVLVAREDMIVDALNMAGAQFGLFPQIVALVLADVGLGTPVTTEQHEFLRRQFSTLMQQLHEQYGIDPGNPPV